MGKIKKQIMRDPVKAASGAADSSSHLNGGAIKNVAEVARHFKSLKTGSGKIALFSGPSGSGKSKAVDKLAAELGLDVNRIELSAVVSKYIGETEKNLARVFDSATIKEGILFFDEADALFGRRTAIRDAHDRYSNVDVNYLLQRIEEHSGPVILITNSKKQLDEALLRRVGLVVEFSGKS